MAWPSTSSWMRVKAAAADRTNLETKAAQRPADPTLHVEQLGLDEIARQLNQRPRKTLDFQTPAERFEACVATTG